ncbi:MAG: phosphatase PAP2 family protein [Candidatus Aenigmatarchaeota archaeon]
MNLAEVDLEVVKFLNVNFFSVHLAYFAIFLIYSVYIYLIYVAYDLFRNRQHKKLFHLFVVAVIGYIFVVSLKYLVGRERPYDADQEINVVFKKADPSFPSSHAFISYLSFFFIPENSPSWLKKFLSIYLLFLIPLSSIYSGVHYPSDVIVGALLGLVFPKALPERASSKILGKIFK